MRARHQLKGSTTGDAVLTSAAGQASEQCMGVQLQQIAAHKHGYSLSKEVSRRKKERKRHNRRKKERKTRQDVTIQHNTTQYNVYHRHRHHPRLKSTRLKQHAQ
jgi:hypothetical protein